MDTSHIYVGVDLGGTSTRAAVGLRDGSLLATYKAPTAGEGGMEGVITGIIDTARQACQRAGVSPDAVEGWGVAAPGPVDRHDGSVYDPPNLPGWRTVPLRALLSERTGKLVRVGNDANLAAVAEWRHGAAVGANDVVYLTVSTGVGGGIIAGGRLLVGRRGAAGELGHMTVDLDGPACRCGNRGDLESLCSGTAIARMAREALDAGSDTTLRALPRAVTAIDVVVAARQGDAVAAGIVARAATALGAGVVNIVNIFNPEVVVIGGGVAQAGPLLFDPVRAAVAARAMRLAALDVRIAAASFGDNAGLVGAVSLAAGALELT